MSARLKLLVTEAWRSLGANLSTTVAATMTVLISMFMLGLFIGFGTWMDSWSTHVKSELLVKIYFMPNATIREKNTLAAQLQQNQYVLQNGVKYVSKEAALADMKRRFPALVAGVAYNPLPDSLQVKPKRGEDIDKLYNAIVLPKLPPGVAKVQDAKQKSHAILRVAHYIDVFFILAAGVLLIASVLLISNTIRLSIFSRRREIEVMKLVGATNWFVRGPFMLEGVFCGLAGAMLAIFFLVIGKAAILPAIVPRLTNDPEVHSWGFPLISLVVLLFGLGVGAFGSGITMRRFLKV
ncbi:MAG TPA: permease-like cell division protein FtsX [Gaiellaceae bacterium]|jgi:cell division transport system permease protein|nr:permease-like cell division protein FtsX [Gaiellaceae bacterium]